MSRATVYNDNLTKDWNNVNDQNKKLVNDFIKYCKSNDKSPATIWQYEEWLKVFFCWNYNENEDKFFINLKKRDFVYYIGWCRDKGMSSNRIANLKSVLNSLSNEIELLYEDEYPMFKNQLRGLEAVHISTVRQKTVLSTEQINDMLSTLVEKKEYQIACYLALACASGARKSELLQMKVSFFIPENEVFNGYMYHTPEVRSKGRGKQGKIIQKYVIKDMFEPFLKLWIEERKRLGIETDDLFVAKHNNQYVAASNSTVDTFTRKISKYFNLDFYSHSSRHYFCSLLKSLELPDDVIVQIFSWADNSGSSMISIYDDTDKDAKLEKFFINLKNEVKGDK